MKKHTFTLLAFAAIAGKGFGQAGFDKARASLDSDIKAALEEQGAAREQIRQEKAPLTAELNKLKSRLENKRREIKNQALLKQTKTANQEALKKEVDARKDAVKYVGTTLLTSYIDTFGTQVRVAEQPQYKPLLEDTQKAMRDEKLADIEKIAAQLQVVDAGIDRLQNMVGGHKFEGQAFSGGEAATGTVGMWGPVVYFSAGPDKAGLAQKGKGEGQLDLISLKPEENQAVANTLANGAGLAPVDATLGDALAIAGTKETIWQHIRKGGIWIYPILGFAALSLVVAFIKTIQISKIKDPDPAILHEALLLLKKNQDSEAFKLAQTELPEPFNSMISSGVSHRNEGKRLVEEVMYERILEAQPKLERNLSFIQITASTAPLMGLLGTVTGMINTFKLITVFGTGDARSLSSGISEALVTTEFGLIVAIPALILYALLNRRVQGILSDMDKLSAAFLNGLPKKKDDGKADFREPEPANA
jgi:biopolymer transport protein ExbB